MAALQRDENVHAVSPNLTPAAIQATLDVLGSLALGSESVVTRLFRRRCVTLPGIAITIKVTSASTGHAFAVFEEVTSPGAGPALLVHRHQFEIFRFLEGTYEVKVGDKLLTAEPRAVAVVLPGHAHAFRNIGERDARLQYIIMPGASSDEFFRQLSRLLRHGEPDMAALDRLGEQFDTLFVGPP